MHFDMNHEQKSMLSTYISNEFIKPWIDKKVSNLPNSNSKFLNLMKYNFMKIKIHATPVILILFSVYLFAFKNVNFNPNTFHKSPLQNGGTSAGKTGAPGEVNCTNCHNGTAQDGSNENVLQVLDGTTPVTSYIPGRQYAIKLTMASNPAKKGFQATALTATNSMAGSFTGITGNTSINGTTRKYANHTSSSNTSSSASAWNWNWTAPVAGTGTVKFYVATNKANNDGNSLGDVIYLSQHTVSEEQQTTGIEEFEFNNNVVIGYNNETHKITMQYDLNQLAKVSLNIVDLNGKSVFNKKSINAEIGNNHYEVSASQFEPGIYIINFFINNKAFSKKVAI